MSRILAASVVGVCLLFTQSAAAQELALPISLPKVTHISFSVGKGVLLGQSPFFSQGVLSGPTELSAEVLFDAGTRDIWLGLTRFEVSLAYKYLMGVSSQVTDASATGFGQTLPELSAYATR